MPRFSTPYLPVLWMAAIFATSCTVATVPQFLGALALLLPPSAQVAFAAFCVKYGILLVKGWHAMEYAILFLLLHRFTRFGVALGVLLTQGFRQSKENVCPR